jgi:hypothetical protein
MENRKQIGIVRIVECVLRPLCCGAVLSLPLSAQAPANPSPQTPSNPAPRANTQKPTQQSNPFPEDTNSVPVLPSANSAGTAAPAPSTDDYDTVPLPGSDGDPVRSPDDESPAGTDSGSSSSSEGLDNLLKPPPDTGKTANKQKADEDDGMAHDSPKEDESVGSYYLDQKNWKAALSRFESALVLDPENPEVYWGLGEAERHLGNYAGAKAHYLKLVDYDPDSKHGKEARRLLKEPELANAPAVSANVPARQSHP